MYTPRRFYDIGPDPGPPLRRARGLRHAGADVEWIGILAQAFLAGAAGQLADQVEHIERVLVLQMLDGWVVFMGELLLKTCANVHCILFLPRIVLLTEFVSERVCAACVCSAGREPL